jgi:hypothetical protein
MLTTHPEAVLGVKSDLLPKIDLEGEVSVPYIGPLKYGLDFIVCGGLRNETLVRHTSLFLI